MRTTVAQQCLCWTSELFTDPHRGHSRRRRRSRGGRRRSTGARGRCRAAARVPLRARELASLHASVLWDEVVAEVAADFPDVACESVLVDAAAARLVLDPG